MKITQTKNDGLAYSFDVVVGADAIEEKMQTELASVSKKVKIPGFRSGKVPMKVLKQKYGKNVMGDVIQNSVNDASRQLMEENNLRPAMQPDIKITEYEDGGDLQFTVELEVLPEVKELKYDSYEVEELVFDVPEEDVDSSMQELLGQHKHFHAKPKDEKAEIGDAVKIDFLGKKDGEPFNGGAAQGFQLELGSGQFIPGFEEQLIGAKAGDEKDLEVTFPKEYHSEDLAGAPVVFEVKVHEVLESHAPEANDEFAKKLGMESLDKLKDAIREKIKADYDGLARSKAKKALFDVLDDAVTFDVPPKMAEMEFEGIWQRIQEMIDKKDESIADRSEEELREEYTAIANRRVRLGIFLSEMGRVNNLQVTREELTSAVMSQARMYPGQEQKVLEFYQQNPNEVDQLRGPILEEKAVDFLLGKVKRKERKVTIDELVAMDAEDDDAPKAKKKPAAKKKTASKQDGEKKPAATKKPAAKKTTKKAE